MDSNETRFNRILQTLICLMFIYLIVGSNLYAKDRVSQSPSKSQNAVKPTFDEWLLTFRQDALDKGISEKTLDSALPTIKQIKRVVKYDRNQPEFKLTFARYLNNVAPKSRVNQGRRLLKKHKKLLRDIRNKFGVQPRFIVAFWGMETSFGRLTGGFKVLDALATLAYDGRRAKYFRKELINALKIIDQGHIQAPKMSGSWAGAMGQTQFMPSTFLAYGVDYNNDGRINIWTDIEDALASAANYLSKIGWDDTQTWGREVQVPASLDKNLMDRKIKKNIAAWQALGVRKKNGSNLPNRNLQASIIKMDNKEGPAYMIYKNYHAIRDWNRSDNFAVSIGILSDRIGRY